MFDRRRKNFLKGKGPGGGGRDPWGGWQPGEGLKPGGGFNPWWWPGWGGWFPYPGQGAAGETGAPPPPGGTGAPPPPPPPGGGGKGGGEKKIKWDVFDYNVPGAPSWWKPMKPSEMNELTQYLAAVNMLLPFMSPEDQRATAAQLYISDPEHFAHLNPELIGPPPSPPAGKYAWIEEEKQRKYFMSGERASAALEALSKLAETSGKKEHELGPGFAFLKSLVSTMSQFGTPPDMLTRGMTRMQMQRMLAAIDPLLGMTESGPLSPYGPVAKAFAFPFLPRELMPFTRRPEGGYLFGKPLPKFRF